MTLKDSIKKQLMERFAAELSRKGITGTSGPRVPVAEMNGAGMGALPLNTRLFDSGVASALRNSLKRKAGVADRKRQGIANAIVATQNDLTKVSALPAAMRAAILQPSMNRLASLKRQYAVLTEEAQAPAVTKDEIMAIAAPALDRIAENMASAGKIQIAAAKEGKSSRALWDKLSKSFIPGSGSEAIAHYAKGVPTTHGTPQNLPEAELFMAAGQDVMIDGFPVAGGFGADIDRGGSAFGADIDRGGSAFGSDIDEGAEGFGHEDSYDPDITDAAQGFGQDARMIARTADISEGATGFSGDIDDGAMAFSGDLDNGATAFGEDIDSGASSFGNALGLVGLGVDVDKGASAFGSDIDEGARAFGEDIDTGGSAFGAAIGLIGLGASPGEDDLEAFGDEETDAFLAHENTEWNFNELKEAGQPARTAATVSVAKKGIQEALRTIKAGGDMAEVKYRLGRMGIKAPGFFQAPRTAGEKAYLEILRSLSANGYVDLTGDIVKKPGVAPAFQRLKRYGLLRLG